MGSERQLSRSCHSAKKPERHLRSITYRMTLSATHKLIVAKEVAMLVPHGAYVMVVDGSKLALFRNGGKDFEPRLDLIEERQRHVPRTSVLGTDQPGHSFQNLGSVGGAHAGTDFHQLAEDAFATDAAAKLGKLLQDEDARAVLVAAPRVLGVVRKQLTPKHRARVIAEIDKDYAGLPAAEVAQMLAGTAA